MNYEAIGRLVANILENGGSIDIHAMQYDKDFNAIERHQALTLLSNLGNAFGISESDFLLSEKEGEGRLLGHNLFKYKDKSCDLRLVAGYVDQNIQS